jgi:hypothetical protein
MMDQPCARHRSMVILHTLRFWGAIPRHPIVRSMVDPYISRFWASTHRKWRVSPVNGVPVV